MFYGLKLLKLFFLKVYRFGTSGKCGAFAIQYNEVSENHYVKAEEASACPSIKNFALDAI